mgnify:FL=1
MTTHNEKDYNDIFYEWEKATYGENPCDYVLSDEDRRLWIIGYRKGAEDMLKKWFVQQYKRGSV